jgi:hypothetical protein
MFTQQSALKKRHFILANAIYLLAISTMIAIGNTGAHSLGFVQGDEMTYNITLNEANAPASLSTSAFESGTGTARYVDFDYAIAKRATGHHVLLDADGTVSNDGEARITSMKSLTATFTGGEATLKTGWRALPTVNEQTLASGTTVKFTNDPYYFSISNTGTGELSLTSIVITYSCAPHEVAGGTTYFGMYPQSRVTDEGLVATLNTAAGTFPNSEHDQAWTGYGYYLNGSVQSLMWYIDITNAGDEYRGVYFTHYRPYFTFFSPLENLTYQDDNGYPLPAASSAYWFKYEPIAWRVLEVQSEKAFLMADIIIDAYDYYYSANDRSNGEETIYANNYEYSHIRSWLNDTFYNTAFNMDEMARIQITDVDNSASSTTSTPNIYACANTSDKVFLLSQLETTSTPYGFTSDASRQLSPTSYALSQGILNQSGNSYWWLRSPHNNSAGYARHITTNGVYTQQRVECISSGVVPALWISL